MARGQPQQKKGGQQSQPQKAGAKPAAAATKKSVHGAAVGIDFGSTTVTLAAFKNGSFEAIVNTDGERYTPLVTGYTQNEVFLGSPAKSVQIKSVSNTVSNVLHFLSKPFASLTTADKALVHCDLIELEDGMTGFSVEHKGEKTLVSPQQIITNFSQQLIKYAQQYWDCPMTAAVLSVPYHFTQEQQTALASAVEKAGFTVLGTVYDPVAAAISFHLDQPLFNKINTFDNSPFATSRIQADNVLVVDVGQHSIKTTLLSIQQGLLKHVGTLAKQGGAGAIDKLLLDYFAKEFATETGEDLTGSSRALVRLKQSVEQVKRAISVSPTAGVQLDGLYMGLDLFSDITKMKFDQLTTDFFAVFSQQLEELFSTYPLKPEDISRVVLAGGSAALARFSTNIQKFFASKNVPHQPTILKHVNICDTIAFGAAKLAATYALELHPETAEHPTDARHVEQKAALTSPTPASPVERKATVGNNCIFTPYTHHTHLALSKSIYIKTFHNTFVTAVQSTSATPSTHYVPFTIQHPKKTFATLPGDVGFRVELVESAAHVPEHVTATNSTTVGTVSLPREAILQAAGENDLTVTVVLQFTLTADFKFTTSVAYHTRGQQVPSWTPIFEANLLDQVPLSESKYSQILPAPTLAQQQCDLMERLIARIQYIISRYYQWKAMPKHQTFVTKNANFMKPFMNKVEQLIDQHFKVIVNEIPNPYAGTQLAKPFAVPAQLPTATALAEAFDTFSHALHDLLTFRKLTPREADQELRRRAKVAAGATTPQSSDEEFELSDDGFGMDDGDDDVDLDMDFGDLDLDEAGGDDDDDVELDIDLDLD